jgi:hypothetical protein
MEGGRSLRKREVASSSSRVLDEEEEAVHDELSMEREYNERRRRLSSSQPSSSQHEDSSSRNTQTLHVLKFQKSTHHYNISDPKIAFELKDSDHAKLKSLNEDTRERCVKALCRLFLFKGRSGFCTTLMSIESD